MDKFFEHTGEAGREGRRPSVVYVDDDAGDLELFRIAATHAAPGTEVFTFDTSAAALGFCRYHAKAPDLIVVDVNMPAFDGFHFIAEARRIPALDRTPIVFLSTTDDPGVMLDAREAGAVGFFVKPIGFHRYARMVQNLLTVADRRPPARFSV
jgi:two-component system chemotaxis response regulator CheY